MIIGIDARFAVHPRRGIGNYTYHLLSYLAEIDRTNTYILYIDKQDSEGVLPTQENFRTKVISPTNYVVWEQVSLPIHAFRDGVEVLHCTGNTSPLWLSKRIKLISTIHDVMYLKDGRDLPSSSSLHQRLGRIYRRINVPLSVNRLNFAITVSNFSKQDIRSHLPKLSDDCISVIPEAPNEVFQHIATPSSDILAKLGIQGDFLLALGGLDPRKNTKFLIEAYCELRSENAITPKLVIAGIPNWRDTAFNRLVEGSPCQDDIIFTDFLSEDDLVCLYNTCKAFIYPSRYEGFGLPPLEAMACGAPVITSDVTSIPEIVEDAAILIDPENKSQMKQEITRLCHDPDLRDTLIAKGFGQVKKFSWKRLANETLTLYRTVAG